MMAMKRAVLSFVLLLLIFSSSLHAEKVRYVTDGDTFMLEDNQRVRMIGINAPEVSHKQYGKRGEPFGSDSKRYLAGLIEGKVIELKQGSEPFDRFGRRLAYVYLPDGTFVNRKMVEAGFAETFRKFEFEYKNDFLVLEQQARDEGRGMWSREPKTWGDLFREWFGDWRKR